MNHYLYTGIFEGEKLLKVLKRKPKENDPNDVLKLVQSKFKKATHFAYYETESMALKCPSNYMSNEFYGV